MKASHPIKDYSADEQRLEQFKREHNLKNDYEAVLFLINELAKGAGE